MFLTALALLGLAAVAHDGASVAKNIVEPGEFKLIYDPAIGAKEKWCINDHTFVKGPDHKWHVIGITHPLPFNWMKDPGLNLAHATADSLTQSPWHKEPFALTADYERYQEHLLWAPHVIVHRGVYHMYVCAGSPYHVAYQIHHLTSKDLRSWERDPRGPMVADGFDARDPMVLRDGKRWIMYYTATSRPEKGNHVVKAMTSTDLKAWTPPEIVFTHERVGDFAGPTESPFVVRRGKTYYLFACDNDHINVWRSKDPLRFEFQEHVARFKAHASEVVRDEEGRWFVSHTGWMTGGLCIAPLTWHDGLDNESTSLDPAPR